MKITQELELARIMEIHFCYDSERFNFYIGKRMKERELNLASDGVVGSELSVAVGDEIQVNGGDDSGVEKLDQMFNDEIIAIGTKGFVVQIH